jgi:hypothetical protein
MERNDFALGVAVGGLAGFAVGYLMSRNGHQDEGPASATIDLTPAMEAGAQDPGRAAPAGASRGRADKE